MHSTRSRSALPALIALLMALAAGVGTAGSASAHDELVSTTPGNTATVTAPTRVVLRFGEPVLTLGLVVAVSGPGVPGAPGAAVGLDRPVVAGTTVTQALRSPVEPGRYTAVWRAVSSDSHPVSGAFTFTVAVPASGATSPVASMPPAPTAPAASAPLSPAPSADGTTGADPAPAGNGRGLAVAGGALVLLLAAVTLATRRARR